MTIPTKAPKQSAPAATWQTRKFTVDEYYRMAEVGILHPDDELIDGEVIVMAPIGSLQCRLGAYVALLRFRDDFYAHVHRAGRHTPRYRNIQYQPGL